MQKPGNRYLLIAAALFLIVSGYMVPAQNVTASPQDAQASSGGSVTSHVRDQSSAPALKGNWITAFAGWFGLVVRDDGPKGDGARMEAAGSQKLAVRENRPGNRTTEFAW